MMTTCGRPGCNIWGEHGDFDAVNIVNSGHVTDSPYELMEHEIERLRERSQGLVWAEVERLRKMITEAEKMLTGEKNDPYDPSGFREAELRGKNVRKNKAKFDVAGVHIDGKSGGSLIIEAPKANGTVLVTFRPKFSRRDYTLTLSEVCEMIAWRAAKKEA